MTQTVEIPKGFKMNGQGHLVPIGSISEVDKARDKLVMSLIPKVEKQQAALMELKNASLSAIDAFVLLSAEKYGAKIGGKKGNISLFSFDGQYKVMVNVNQIMAFDERLQVAKQLIDDCIHRWMKGSRKEIKAIVDRAFKTDKAGNISVGQVLQLRQIETDDESWKKAMDAIADSVQTIDTKRYVRFYKREGDSNQWNPISLDIAAL